MDDRELSRFLKQILISSPPGKAAFVLSELERILRQQSTPMYQLQMVQTARDCYPETRDVAIEKKYDDLTLSDLKIAAERNRLRIQREEELRNAGRC